MRSHGGEFADWLALRPPACRGSSRLASTGACSRSRHWQAFAPLACSDDSCDRASALDINRMIRGADGTSDFGLLRKAVVIVEVALSFVLLVGSGLMARSFLDLRRVDPGYDPRGMLTFS